MFGSSTTKKVVMGESVVTEQLTIGDRLINEIIPEIANEPNKLITASAVFNAFRDIKKVVDMVDPTNNLFQDTSVITETLISPLFSPKDEWYGQGFSFQAGKAILVDKNIETPFISIPSSPFVKLGAYLLRIEVDRLENASLLLVGPNNEHLYLLDEEKTYYLEVFVEDLSVSSTFNLISTDHSELSIVSISHLGVHRIADRFYYYLRNLIDEFVGESSSQLVTRAYVDNQLLNLNEEIQTRIENVVSEFTNHLMDTNNPHGVTFEQVGAAPAFHTHTYIEVGAAAENHTHAPEELGMAAIDHTHPEYMEITQAEQIRTEVIDTIMNSVPHVHPLTILQAPTGILPHGLRGENIQTRTQLLKPSLFNHDSAQLYDEEAGFISASVQPVNGSTLPDLLELNENQYVYFNEDALNSSIHYNFHTSRLIKGYTLHLAPTTCRLEEWDFYTDYSTFQHRGMAHNTELDKLTLMLPEPISVTSFTFNIKELHLIPDGDTTWGIRLELHFADVVENGISVSCKDVLVSVPHASTTKVVHISDFDEIIIPDNHTVDIPLYMYLDVSDQITAGYSTIPPEYSMERIGTNITKHMVNSLYSTDDNTYVHPEVGSLMLDTDIPNILDIFKPDNKDTVTIDETITSLTLELIKPLVLCGYRLEFNLDDTVPTEWSLEIKAVVNGEIQDLVIDSSKSFNGNMIINPYGETNMYVVDLPKYTVTEIKLNLKNDVDNKIELVKWIPFFSNDWYCIPTNTMYNLLEPVNRIYIGSAEYEFIEDYSGYIVHNSVLGKLTSQILNELHPCVEFGLYAIDNPFFTKQISVDVNAVSIGGDIPDTAPSAIVEEIDIDTIYVRTYSPHRFVVDIVRNW